MSQSSAERRDLGLFADDEPTHPTHSPQNTHRHICQGQEDDVHEILDQVTILYSPGPSEVHPRSVENDLLSLGVTDGDEFEDLLRWFDEEGDAGVKDVPRGVYMDDHSNHILEQVERQEDIRQDFRPVDVTAEDWNSPYLGLDVPYDDEAVDEWEGIVVSDEDWSEEEHLISGASTPQGADGFGFDAHQHDVMDKRRDVWEIDVPLVVPPGYQHSDEFDGIPDSVVWSQAGDKDSV